MGAAAGLELEPLLRRRAQGRAPQAQQQEQQHQHQRHQQPLRLLQQKRPLKHELGVRVGGQRERT